jgi:hypothetical protein
MSRDLVKAACFLCGEACRYYEFDANKRRHYLCTGLECSEYIITDTARKRLADGAIRRKQMQQFVKARTSDTMIVEMWVNPETKELEARVLDRASGGP